MERWVKGAAVAKVAVASSDVVRDATNGERTLEDGRPTCVCVAMVVYCDACPTEGVPGLVESAGGIGTHALC